MALFTRETAKEMSAKANKVRWSKPVPPLLPATPEEMPAIIAGDSGAQFREEVLSRVRLEIQSTLDKLKLEDEPKCRESLSRSLGVLLEHEGHLSGRPKSGIMKPSQAKPPKSRTSYPEPQPQFTQISEPVPQTTPQPVVVDPFSEVQI